MPSPAPATSPTPYDPRNNPNPVEAKTDGGPFPIMPMVSTPAEPETNTCTWSSTPPGKSEWMVARRKVLTCGYPGAPPANGGRWCGNLRGDDYEAPGACVCGNHLRIYAHLFRQDAPRRRR